MKSARKRIPEVAKQICDELGLAEDDTQTLTVAAILVTFHQDTSRDACAPFQKPAHQPDCPASIESLGKIVTPACNCGAEPETVPRGERQPR